MVLACFCLVSASAQPTAAPVAEVVRYVPVPVDISPLFDLIEPPMAQTQAVTAVPGHLNITKFKNVRVTACSPEDPGDKEYYRIHGYEGNTYGVATKLSWLPKGTLIRVPGYLSGAWVYVDSSGGSVIRRSFASGIRHIDVKFRTLYSVSQWGNQFLDIEVIFPKDQNEASNALKVRK